MDEVVRWLRIVALLLAVLVVQVGWVGVQLLIRPASAQSRPVPVPVYIVNGPYAEAHAWARVSGSALLVELRPR
ncbi:MAG: hypothetical protein QME77_11325 [bacterium]|nr:hypothetical protein [bacterium]